MDKSKSIDEVFALLDSRGEADYIGEPVSQKQHMLEAAYFAEKANYQIEMVLAALFHDIGHLLDGEAMGEYGVKSHEKKGADYLREHGFSELVAELVENHVNAKRYLVVKKSGYMENLSLASTKTLEFQGGPMSKAEFDDFEAKPNFGLYLKLRELDEMAKEPDLKTPNLEYYRAKAKAFYCD